MVKCVSICSEVREALTPKAEFPCCPLRRFLLSPSFHRWLSSYQPPSWLDRKQTMSLKAPHLPTGVGRNAKCLEICHLMWQGHCNTWHRKGTPALIETLYHRPCCELYLQMIFICLLLLLPLLHSGRWGKSLIPPEPLLGTKPMKEFLQAGRDLKAK